MREPGAHHGIEVLQRLLPSSRGCVQLATNQAALFTASRARDGLAIQLGESGWLVAEREQSLGSQPGCLGKQASARKPGHVLVKHGKGARRSVLGTKAADCPR